MPVLFISDLHLEAGRPDITRALLGFLTRHAGRCRALYILGDLFELWIGDDEPSALADEVASALRAFAGAGAAVRLMRGNRDFLLGEDFARRCGGLLLDEPHLLETGAGRALLLHGDSLCVDDADYMAFRGMVRDPVWQADFLARPLPERRRIAGRARAESRERTAGKDEAIMDVNPSAVLELIGESGCARLIHGHTHRPAVHDIELDRPVDGAARATRLVLGDWDRQGWYAELDGAALSLRRFPLDRGGGAPAP